MLLPDRYFYLCRMNLVVDIGNTRLKMALFQYNILRDEETWTHWTPEDVVAYGWHNDVQRVILSSVAEADERLQEMLSDAFDFMELTHETPLPFQNLYRTPQTLGKDRLAAVAGAHTLYPGQSCMVVDCGTCIKYDVLTSDGRYLGGNIAPGLSMRIKAMHHFTARLPEVPMTMPPSDIGDSTETALQNGALMGAILEIKGFVERFEQQLGEPLTLLLAGGDADFVAIHLKQYKPHLKSEPKLTLYGLHHILTSTKP